MIYNTFTNEQDAINAQAVDFQMFKSSKPQIPAKYWEITVAWDEVRKREDAEEWFYAVCPDGIQTHEQKEVEPSWYRSS